MYVESRLLEVEWGDATIRAESATIEVTERWGEDTLFDAATRRCKMKVPAQTVTQIYTLERLGGRWMIVRNEDHPDNPEPKFVPCS
jgi:hypothetical protein